MISLAVLSDTHGNRWALEAVLDDLSRAGPDATSIWVPGMMQVRLGDGCPPCRCRGAARLVASASHRARGAFYLKPSDVLAQTEPAR